MTPQLNPAEHLRLFYSAFFERGQRLLNIFDVNAGRSLKRIFPFARVETI